MPGKGLGTAAKRISEAAARPAKKNPKMELLKGKIAPLKKKNAPMEKMKKMPLKKGPSQMPMKGDKPEFMKPGYKPGSIMRGYTKYA